MDKQQQNKSWSALDEENKKYYQEQYAEHKTISESGVPKLLEDLFGSHNLQSKPLTYKDVATSLFMNKEFYRFNGNGGVFCDDYRVYSNDNFWNPLNCISEKQAEKLLAINRLLNVARFLNGKDWKPDWKNHLLPKYFILLNDENTKIEIDWYGQSNSSLVYFRTKEMAKQAIQILGEDTIRLALTTDY